MAITTASATTKRYVGTTGRERTGVPPAPVGTPGEPSFSTPSR